MRWSPYDKKSEVEIETEDRAAFVYFAYPDISDPKERCYLHVDLMHVRAADGIRIYFDGERNGWAIERPTVSEWAIDDPVCDEGWKEVAFVDADLEEEKDE